MTELERLGNQLDAIETALEVASRQPAGPQRRRMLASVQRAAGAARQEHRRSLTGAPDLRVIPGGKLTTSGSDDASEKTGQKEFAAAAVAITATVVIAVGVTLSLMNHAGHSEALPAPRPSATLKPAPRGQSPTAPPPLALPSASPSAHVDVLRPADPVEHAMDAQMATQPPTATSTPVAPSAPQNAPSSALPSAPATTSATPPASSPRCLPLHLLGTNDSVCADLATGQSHTAR